MGTVIAISSIFIPIRRGEPFAKRPLCGKGTFLLSLIARSASPFRGLGGKGLTKAQF